MLVDIYRTVMWQVPIASHTFALSIPIDVVYLPRMTHAMLLHV